MDEAGTTTGRATQRASRVFEFAPPRRFVLPALLLLLSERPGYGYSLEKDLRELDLGKIDRPTVYRALGHLEKDALVESRSETSTSGHERRVYRITPAGERVLGAWMSVVKEERDLLSHVLNRYRATGSADAILAEVEGGWAAALGSGWSPVSPTSATRRHLKPVSTERFGASNADATPDGEPLVVTAPRGDHGARRFRLSPERSVVLVEVRSTVGPLSFGAIGVNGHIDASVYDGAVHTEPQPAAHVEIDVTGLRSGNGLYDAELLRRIDARRFPRALLDLAECAANGAAGRHRLTGELTFHGVTRPVDGSVQVEVPSDSQLVVTGEQVFDIRDFDVPSPTVLMLRIYPDVRVHLHVEAELEEA